MQISKQGLAEIELSEGFSSTPYWDKLGKAWTIGFGETNGIGPHTKKITRKEAEQQLIHRFNKDYAWALKPFLELRGFNQNMYDALASFIWNCGTGSVSPSTRVGRLLRQRNWAAAGTAMLAWSKADGQFVKGLHDRRLRERKLLLKPVITVARWMLTPWELETVEELESRRRIKNRNGGWDEVSPAHLRAAAKAKAELKKRLGQLQDSDTSKAHRAARIIIIRDVIAG